VSTLLPKVSTPNETRIAERCKYCKFILSVNLYGSLALVSPRSSETRGRYFIVYNPPCAATNEQRACSEQSCMQPELLPETPG